LKEFSFQNNRYSPIQRRGILAGNFFLGLLVEKIVTKIKQPVAKKKFYLGY